MNYKTCKILNDNFKLDDKYNVFLNVKKKIEITDGLEKGYIYAAMYFYDDVQREIRKLDKVIRKHLDAINLDSPNMEIPLLLVELSRRVAAAIGDDSLDALVKEVLSETHKHLTLAKEAGEVDKLDAIKESILTENLGTLFDTVIKDSAKNDKGYKSAALSEAYVEKLTERQKKLVSPAVKMVGFLNDVRLDEFELTKDFSISFKLYSTSAPFKVKEESIKRNLKKLMDDNI